MGDIATFTLFRKPTGRVRWKAPLGGPFIREQRVAGYRLAQQPDFYATL